MCAIEEMDLAMGELVDGESIVASVELYLAPYGVLQSLFVQQGARTSLLRGLGLGMDFDEFPRLDEIRDIRTRAFGHLTRYERGKGKDKIVKHMFLVRISLTKTSFELHETAPGTDTGFTAYKTDSIIPDQARGIQRALK